MRTEVPSVPPSGPPGFVGLIMFELTGQKDRDQNLVDGTLNEDYGNKTKNGMRGVPKFQEPLKVKIRSKRVALRGTEFNDIPGIRRTRSSQAIRGRGR